MYTSLLKRVSVLGKNKAMYIIPNTDMQSNSQNQKHGLVRFGVRRDKRGNSHIQT